MTEEIKICGKKMEIRGASEPVPFARHEGLFVATSKGYIYVKPLYDKKDDTIIKYAKMNGGSIGTDGVMPFDLGFIDSQFDFYRGEWTEGALRDGKMTEKGLNAAALLLSGQSL